MEKAESRHARQDRAGHGEGRRPRHRQEPGRDHPGEQRLSRSSTSASRCRPSSSIAACASTSRTSSASPGLLVKSAQQMVVDRRGPARGRHRDARSSSGGAALTRKFTATRIAAGVRRARRSTPRTRWTGSTSPTGSSAPTTREALVEQRAGRAGGAARRRRRRPVQAPAPAGAVAERARRSRATSPVPAPPDLERCTCCATCRSTPRLPVPEPADAPRQAPRREGLGRRGCSSRATDKARDQRGGRGAQARGARSRA